MNGKMLAVAAVCALCQTAKAESAAKDYDRDFTTGTAGCASSAACGAQCAAVEKAEMQAAVQKILDGAVKCGRIAGTDPAGGL